ncbi:MAG: polyhydroxyalkanoate synthesis repressor PhaR [Inquilinaceae bacterium]
MADQTSDKKPPITIKKYANRRLYNTATSSYVTLEHLCQMVKEGSDFVVYDAKSGDDITRSVLTQIIVEEEAKGQTMLPIGFLRQLIGLYGDNMQWMVPQYLEHSMESFARNQDRMREYFKGTIGGVFPLGALEEMSKQNMAMFERTMKMFSPFQETPSSSDTAGSGETGDASAPGASEANLNELRQRLDALQRELQSIGRKDSDKKS